MLWNYAGDACIHSDRGPKNSDCNRTMWTMPLLRFYKQHLFVASICSRKPRVAIGSRKAQASRLSFATAEHEKLI